MIALEADFPGKAEAISLAAASDELLKEVLRDYEQVCNRMMTIGITSQERAQWAEVRAELIVEINRIVARPDDVLR